MLYTLFWNFADVNFVICLFSFLHLILLSKYIYSGTVAQLCFSKADLQRKAKKYDLKKIFLHDYISLSFVLYKWHPESSLLRKSAENKAQKTLISIMLTCMNSLLKKKYNMHHLKKKKLNTSHITLVTCKEHLSPAKTAKYLSTKNEKLPSNWLQNKVIAD